MYANQSKLLRAKQWARENGKDGDEEAIKARYVQLGGLLLPVEETQAASHESASVSEEPKPKKARKTKDDLDA